MEIKRRLLHAVSSLARRNTLGYEYRLIAPAYLASRPRKRQPVRRDAQAGAGTAPGFQPLDGESGPAPHKAITVLLVASGKISLKPQGCPRRHGTYVDVRMAFVNCETDTLPSKGSTTAPTSPTALPSSFRPRPTLPTPWAVCLPSACSRSAAARWPAGAAWSPSGAAALRSSRWWRCVACRGQRRTPGS